MNSELLRPINTEEIDIYHRDGVVPLRGMFNENWIKLLNKGHFLSEISEGRTCPSFRFPELTSERTNSERTNERSE